LTVASPRQLSCAFGTPIARAMLATCPLSDRLLRSPPTNAAKGALQFVLQPKARCRAAQPDDLLDPPPEPSEAGQVAPVRPDPAAIKPGGEHPEELQHA
jgi:hypothetical protein